MMMLRSSDLALKRFAQAFGESAMEGVKQSILDHELTFRIQFLMLQVRELHRLYWTQKNLMNELCQNRVNALYRNEEALLKNHQRSFNLQLPADDFISICGNDLDNNNFSETDLSNANRTFDIEKGLVSSGVSGRNEFINDNISETKEFYSGDFEAQIEKGPGLFGSKSTVLCDKDSLSIKRSNVYCVPTMVHFGEGQDTILQEERPHISFFGLDNSNMACKNDHSSKTHEFKPVLIDLNVSHEDESFHHQNDSGIKIPFPSMDSSVVPHGFIQFEPTENCPDTSEPDLANPGTITPYQNKAEWLFPCSQDSQPHSSPDSMLADNITKNNSDIDNRMDINAVSSNEAISTNETPISSMELSEQEKEVEDFPSRKLRFIAVSDNKRQDSNNTSSNSINLPQSVTRDATEKLSNDEESEVDTLSSHAIVEDEAQQDALLIKFSFEYKSNGISGCSSYEKGADNSVITQFLSPENEMSDIGKSKYEEQDTTTLAAAETLMTISFGRSAITTKKIDQPQPSSDSFEFMTMHLSEIQNEEDYVMTDILTVNETEKDEKWIRPRRGKRLQDFQKKILPGLVSLSRHEICEDLYNISYTVRRNRVTSTTGNFFVPVRSRRSRSYSGRQRRRSFQWFQAGNE